MKQAYAYLATLISVVVLDAIWLSVSISHYKKYLAHVFAPKFLWWPAVVFYLLFAFALYFLVVRAFLGEGLAGIFLAGMIFGAAAYGTYDLTNQATIKEWPVLITLIDIVWGSLLAGVSALIGALVLRH